MKRSILFAIGLVALATVPASAADMAARVAKAPPPPPAPVWNWTGFYLGVNGGYGWARSTHTDIFGLTSGGFTQRGGLVGGTLGYNWQTGPAVLGIETDLDWARINGSTPGCFAGNCFTNIQAFGTLRGRLGYAINNWMPFISGGLAYADIRAGQDGFGGTSNDQWRAGWTIGGGVEVMFAPSWTAKIEYLYADFGTGNVVTYTPVGGVGVGATERNVNILRGGINYKFDWGGPVVARY